MINERKMRCRQVKAARYVGINFALKTTSVVLTCNRNVDNSQSENAIVVTKFKESENRRPNTCMGNAVSVDV